MPRRGLLIRQSPVATLSESELKQLLPHASKSTISLNSGTCSANTESGVRNGVLEKSKTKAGYTGKRAVSITSYRVRKCDVEGLCGKWHLDALRYAGLIHDDTEEDITYQIQQKKVASKKEEKTLIEITFQLDS